MYYVVDNCRVAAALHDLQIDCWVMNVVPVSGFNTLPVIYDRGLIGVMHDWYEKFSWIFVELFFYVIGGFILHDVANVTA